MKLRCITISDKNKIPILDEVTIKITKICKLIIGRE